MFHEITGRDTQSFNVYFYFLINFLILLLLFFDYYFIYFDLIYIFYEQGCVKTHFKQKYLMV